MSLLLSLASLCGWLFVLGGTCGKVLGITMGAWVTWESIGFALLGAMVASYLSHVFAE